MKKLKKYIYIAAVLAMSVSCKKEEPDPNDDGLYACSKTAKDWILVAKFENEPADYGVNALLFKSSFAIENYMSNYRQSIINICEFSFSKVKRLEETFIFTNEYIKNPRYKYRVWGRIFWARDINNSIAGVPFLFTQIDKIEKIP